MSEATRAALERLAAEYGIQPGYHDIAGRWRRVPDAGLVALLAELGVDAGNPLSIERSLEARRRDRWRETLAPVIAIEAGAAAWRLSLRLPREQGSIALDIEEEGGARRALAIDVSAWEIAAHDEIDGGAFVERHGAVELALPAGYHQLRLRQPRSEALVVAAPERCYRPAAIDGDGRVWGPAVQLYALRSARNWGIGDFGDLERLVEDWAALGADIVGLNPLHALLPAQAAHASPYSPSSREHLNALYIDVEAVPEFASCEAARRLVACAAFQARLAALRAAPLVDYAGVAQAKRKVLELLHARFREAERAAGSARAAAFRDFQRAAGPRLRLFAIHEARQAEQTGVAAPEERIEFHEYLQWEAGLQLARVGARCAARQMGVGLYLDLAVSSDRAGADLWSDRALYAAGASIGAPRDDFNALGQDWGLPPPRPDRLRADGYGALRRALGAVMRDAGAIRIDHVMGLMRLFWIPPGGKPADGAYVNYGFDEQVAVLVLESHRNRCAVIGEALGNVPDAVREKLDRIGALAYRLMYFEREPDGSFRPPAHYPRDALIALSTHDLPTLEGWWRERDLDWRDALGLHADPASSAEQRAQRGADRKRLVAALERAGLSEAAAGDNRAPPPAAAVHAFLAAAPSCVLMVQIEDILGVAEQANLPGTTVEHPNWRRRLPVDVASLASDPRVASIAARLRALRPRSPK